MILRTFHIIFILIIFGCKEPAKKQVKKLPQQEKIILIEYKIAGGFFSYNDQLSVTKDSIKFTDRLKKVTQRKNDIYKWQKLVNSFTLQDFRKVKSSRSVQPVDGIDQIIIVHTNKSSDTILNGEADEQNFRKIFPLSEELDKIMGSIDR